MVEVGFFSLCMALVISGYALMMSGTSYFLKLSQSSLKVVSESIRLSFLSIFLCLLLTSLVLLGSLFTHDFSLNYVYRYSSLDMPPMYLFTAFWSALEGSHLLWTVVMSGVVCASIFSVRRENKDYLLPLFAAYSLTLLFMLFLNVTFSPPLERLFPVGKFGEGMNALLQNPYMAIHPPMLFFGYCLSIVPFAYSLGALWRGRFTSDWLPVVRRWSLVNWAILTTAIFLGGKWAYVELGWAGYWAWDPVENSSFMPWLSLTAFIHSLIIFDKTKELPRLTLFLGMLTFTLTFLATFITRSGVISSVHSFAESQIGPCYLTWVLLLFFITIFMLYKRGESIKSLVYLSLARSRRESFALSKEKILYMTLFFFLFLLVLVSFGTLLPLIIEAIRGVKISIQQPFYNAFMPWVGIGMVGLLGLGNLLRWKSRELQEPLVTLVLPLLWSGIFCLVIFHKRNLDIKSSIAFFLVIWTIFVLLLDCLFKIKDSRWNSVVFLKFNRPYLGSLITHLGFLVAVLGFAGNYRGMTADIVLNKNQSLTFFSYTLTNQGLSYSRDYNAHFISASIAAEHLNGQSSIVTPMRSKFTNSEQWFNEVGVNSTVWHDLYIVLSSFDINSQSVTLRVSINPMVKFVWVSLVIMLLGVVLSFSHRARRRDEEQQPQDALYEKSWMTLLENLKKEKRGPL